jgi:hypothetical protein
MSDHSEIAQKYAEQPSGGVRTEPVSPDHSGDELERAPRLPAKVEKALKPKRVLSEKQLENLAKAREKARVVNRERNERKRQLKADEKKVKELRIKKRETEVRSELEVMQQAEPEPEPAPTPKKRKAKAKKKRVVYYSSSSSESEVEYVRKPSRKRRPREEPRPVMFKEPEPTGPSAEELRVMEERALEHEYQEKLRKMKRQVIMNSVFPMG